MLLIVCPYCGKRPELEFTYGGQAHLVRPVRPGELDDQSWTDFLYMRSNTKGVYAERWRHARGCGRFFNAVRDTTTDHFIATYKPGEPSPLPDTGSVSRVGATDSMASKAGADGAAGVGSTADAGVAADSSSAAGASFTAGSGFDGGLSSAGDSGTNS